jgi:hypothetical protein
MTNFNQHFDKIASQSNGAAYTEVVETISLSEVIANGYNIGLPTTDKYGRIVYTLTRTSDGKTIRIQQDGGQSKIEIRRCPDGWSNRDGSIKIDPDSHKAYLVA